MNLFCTYCVHPSCCLLAKITRCLTNTSTMSVNLFCPYCVHPSCLLAKIAIGISRKKYIKKYIKKYLKSKLEVGVKRDKRTEKKPGMIQYYITVYQSILEYTKAYQGIQENIN